MLFPSESSLTFAQTTVSWVSATVLVISSFAVFVLLTIPVNWVDPNPTATKPKLPNEEFEFVRSHCAPDPAKIPISQLIVNIETNCA